MARKTNHIDDVEMALYVSGYLHFPKGVPLKIIQHLQDCKFCEKRFEKAFEEAVHERALEKEIEDRKVAPASDISTKFREIPERFIGLLLQTGMIYPQGHTYGLLPLITEGYGYTGPTNKRKEKRGAKKAQPFSTEDRFQMLERICSILEIFTDERIPFSERAALAEELLLLVKKRWHKYKVSQLSTKKRKAYKLKRDQRRCRN